MWPQALWFDEGDLLQDTRAASLYQNEWIEYENAKERGGELTQPQVKLLGDVSNATSAQVDITSLIAGNKLWHRGIEDWGDAVRVTGGM